MAELKEILNTIYSNFSPKNFDAGSEKKNLDSKIKEKILVWLFSTPDSVDAHVYDTCSWFDNIFGDEVGDAGGRHHHVGATHSFSQLVGWGVTMAHGG